MYSLQACEQLNAWLAGYEYILKKFTIWNFNWFLHAILYIHSKKVLKKRAQKSDSTDSEDSDTDDDD